MPFERMTAAQYLAELGLAQGRAGGAPFSGAGAAAAFGRRLGPSSGPASFPSDAPRKPRKMEEEQLQRDCFEWIKFMAMSYPVLEWTHHSPNGGLRTKAEAGRLKAMGVKSGYPDLVNHRPAPDHRWRGFAVELKSSTGRLSEDQKEWLDAFEEDGYLTGVARTLDQFMSLVGMFLDPSKPSPFLGLRK